MGVFLLALGLAATTWGCFRLFNLRGATDKAVQERKDAMDFHAARNMRLGPADGGPVGGPLLFQLVHAMGPAAQVRFVGAMFVLMGLAFALVGVAFVVTA